MSVFKYIENNQIMRYHNIKQNLGEMLSLEQEHPKKTFFSRISKFIYLHLGNSVLLTDIDKFKILDRANIYMDKHPKCQH